MATVHCENMLQALRTTDFKSTSPLGEIIWQIVTVQNNKIPNCKADHSLTDSFCSVRYMEAGHILAFALLVTY